MGMVGWIDELMKLKKVGRVEGWRSGTKLERDDGVWMDEWKQKKTKTNTQTQFKEHMTMTFSNLQNKNMTTLKHSEIGGMKKGEQGRMVRTET